MTTWAGLWGQFVWKCLLDSLKGSRTAEVSKTINLTCLNGALSFLCYELASVILHTIMTIISALSFETFLPLDVKQFPTHRVIWK